MKIKANNQIDVRVKKMLSLLLILGVFPGIAPCFADDSQAADHTGDFQVQVTGTTTQKTIHYNCNSLNVFVNNGANLDGDVDCNKLTLAINGLAKATLTGTATSVNVQDLNGQGQLDLTGMTIGTLEIAMVNSGAIGRFTISKNAHVRFLQGRGTLYFRAEDDADPMPVVSVDQINGVAWIHQCGVSVRVIGPGGTTGKNGTILDDCDW